MCKKTEKSRVFVKFRDVLLFPFGNCAGDDPLFRHVDIDCDAEPRAVVQGREAGRKHFVVPVWCFDETLDQVLFARSTFQGSEFAGELAFVSRKVGVERKLLRYEARGHQRHEYA